MNLEKIAKTLIILNYILHNPHCQAPEIRDFLKIKHTPTLTKEERDFYALLSKLEKERYIFKLPIKKKGSGGAQFNLKITEKGYNLLHELKSKRILPDHFPVKQHIIIVEKQDSDELEQIDRQIKKKEKKKEITDEKTKNYFNSVLKIFSSEVFDIIFDLLQNIMRDNLKIDFETLEFSIQNKIINEINEAVDSIKNKTSEIAKIFAFFV
ncbi:MAG: hypothetical protein ACTSQS_00425 [Promethearchaeota archaeon]